MTDVHARLTAALSDRYRIEREIGAGGMATVYLAEDIRHERRVAIKVLHPELAAVIGAERFLAEIRLTAGLQHPHILPLFDSGSADGLLYFVMPFIEGETLRVRLDREQQLPVADAVRIASEVADALEYAHQRNIVHRDIKPENILLHNGRPLVADFGIALAVQQAGGNRLTQTGLSLGTPQYMSPEQATGERSVDARADIYALAAVTYEMLTGEPPFTGANTQAIIAKLLTSPPLAISTQRRTVPAHVEQAVLTSLEKLPADRHTSAAAFATALITQIAGPVSARRPAKRAWASGRAVAAVIGVLVIGSGSYAMLHDSVVALPRHLVMDLMPPPGEAWASGGDKLAVSPTGDRIVIATSGGPTQSELVLRSFSDANVTRLRGTTGGFYPFWSPDGRHIGFFADRSLKVMEVSSLSIRTLCPAVAPLGGSWGADGEILYVPESAAKLHHVNVNDGECAEVPIRTQMTRTDRPYFLPDGKHYIIHIDGNTWFGRAGEDSLTLLRRNNLTRTAIAGPDYLLFREDGLYAQKIDVRRRRLVGDPRRIFEEVANGGGRTAMSASFNGVIAAQGTRRNDQRGALLRIGRDGSVLDSIEYRAGWTLGGSRDGQRIASGGWGLWLIERGVITRLPAEIDTVQRPLTYPIWSPQDTAIVFGAGGSRIVVYDIRAGRSRLLLQLPVPGRGMSLTDWSSDGRFIIFEVGAGSSSQWNELWTYEITADTAYPLFAEAANVGRGRVSANGRHVAYVSTISGREEIYIRSFPHAGVAVRITSDGGTAPRWLADGRLVYVAEGSSLRAVRLLPDGGPEAGPHEVLFAAGVVGGLARGNFVLSRDGSEVTDVSAPLVTDNRITVVFDWWALLEERRGGLFSRFGIGDGR